MVCSHLTHQRKVCFDMRGLLSYNQDYASEDSMTEVSRESPTVMCNKSYL